MHPAVRTQVDGKQRAFSKASAIDCSDSRDMARQEFKAEADTNLLLARFGVGVPQKAITFGDRDMVGDPLQTALAAIATARQAYRDLPPEIRAEYPTWQRLVSALQSRKLNLDEKAKTTEVVESKEDTPVGAQSSGKAPPSPPTPSKP